MLPTCTIFDKVFLTDDDVLEGADKTKQMRLISLFSKCKDFRHLGSIASQTVTP